jgi:hypothetical protein
VLEGQNSVQHAVIEQTAQINQYETRSETKGSGREEHTLEYTLTKDSVCFRHKAGPRARSCCKPCLRYSCVVSASQMNFAATRRAGAERQ